MFLNTDFENWTGNIPNSWEQYYEKLLNSSVLTTSKNIAIFKTGTSSCKLDCGMPLSGIQQINSKKYAGEVVVNVYPTVGSAFINFAKVDDSSVYFEKQDEHNYGFSNARGFQHVILRNGKRAKIFTLSNTDELGNHGYIYIKIEGEEPRIIYNDSNYQQLISCYYKFDSKECILYHRIDSGGLTSVYLIESIDSFASVSRHIKLISSSLETQSYNILKMSNGMTIIPFQIYKNGRYELDVLYSNDDLATWSMTNFSKYGDGLSARGLMETKAYELNSNTAVLISRSESGYLIRNDFNTTTKTISSSSNTILASSSTTFSIFKVDSRIVVAYSSTNKDKGIALDNNSPRGLISIAVLNLNFDTVENMIILCTNNTFKGSFNQGVPYCHSPMMFKHNDKLYVTVEYVTYSGINSYSFVGDLDNILTYDKSITAELNTWNELKVFYPKGANKIQIVSGYQKSSIFYVDSLTYSSYRLYVNLNNQILEIPYFNRSNKNINKTIIKLNSRLLEISSDEELEIGINDGFSYSLCMNENNVFRKMLTVR